MGNHLCCDENREANTLSKISVGEEDSQLMNGNKMTNSKNENDNKNIDNNLDYKNSKSKENNILDDINNLKSSIFDNENENDTDKFNYEVNDIDNNFKSLTIKKKENIDIINQDKSGNNSNILDNKILKNKRKDKNNNIHNNYKKSALKIKENENNKVKNIINNNPYYKNSPLNLSDFNKDKENDFYLINTSNYIGLKNTNNNLVFMKNNKDILLNKSEQIPLFKNNAEIDNRNKNLGNINNNIISNTQKTTSVNPNIIVTARSHNLPYGEKLSDKIYTNSSQKDNNKKTIDDVNKFKMVENIHNNNTKIIEIYIKNQLNKIIKTYKNYKKKPKSKLSHSNTNKESKPHFNLDNISKNTNNNSKIKTNQKIFRNDNIISL